MQADLTERLCEILQEIEYTRNAKWFFEAVHFIEKLNKIKEKIRSPQTAVEVLQTRSECKEDKILSVYYLLELKKIETTQGKEVTHLKDFQKAIKAYWH